MQALAVHTENESIVKDKCYLIKPVQIWKNEEDHVIVFPINNLKHNNYLGIYPMSWFVPQEQIEWAIKV